MLQRALTTAGGSRENNKRPTMLYWALVFFVIAIVAAFFGFGGISADTAWIAKVLFVVFLALTVVAFLVGRRGPTAA
jgi:uncharacterized membrane protein YtjA (UPF0391 family)